MPEHAANIKATELSQIIKIISFLFYRWPSRTTHRTNLELNVERTRKK